MGEKGPEKRQVSKRKEAKGRGSCSLEIGDFECNNTNPSLFQQLRNMRSFEVGFKLLNKRFIRSEIRFGALDEAKLKVAFKFSRASRCEAATPVQRVDIDSGFLRCRACAVALKHAHALTHIHNEEVKSKKRVEATCRKTGGAVNDGIEA